MTADPLWDPAAPADPELARLEAALGPLRHRGAPPVLPPRRRAPRRVPVAAAAVALAAAAALAVWWARRDGADPPGCAEAPGAAMRFEAIAGVPTCGGAAARAGWLPVGEWLETGAGARARVEIADIGRIELAERSRLALVATGPAEHRLALARGALHARVTAPPRLFVVETPAATAVDLGCEYTLEVGDDGAGALRVTAGMVELAGAGRVVVVPAGAGAWTRPGAGPGIPWALDAPPALRAAIDRFDAGDPAAVEDVLREVRPADTVTLWNLLPHVDAAARARIHDALERWVAAPPTVIRDQIEDGDPEAIGRWREALEGVWMVPELLAPDDLP